MDSYSQPELFHETLIDALKDVVLSLGGIKRVASQLWPEKTIDEAARRLADCLNPDRRERLDPEQVLWLLRQGRAGGCHAAMNFVCREAGYKKPIPLEPEDQKAILQREYIEATKMLMRLSAQIERLGV